MLASCEVMDLEMRQLEMFAATARTGSFTAAARELGVGQPAVSQTVRRLEEQLGMVLFERTGRSVIPTGAATALLPSALAALEAFGSVRRTAEHLADGLAGTLRMVSTPGSISLLRSLLDDFATIRPEVRIEFVPRPERGRREALRRSEIDFALVRTAVPARSIRYAPVHHEPWYVVLASDHPLAGAGKPVELADLAQWPFASLGAHAPSPALTVYRTAAQAQDLVPRIEPAFSAFDDLLTAVVGGRAWTLMTAANTSALVDGSAALPAPEALGQAELWLAHRARPSPLEQALLMCAVER